MKTQDISLRRAAAPQAWTPGNSAMPVHRAERRRSSASAVRLRRISGLAGQAYEQAPPCIRAQMLEKLLRAMSPYALISVAGGVFAQIKGRNAEWQGFRIRPEDIAGVDAHHIAALVDLVQQVNSDAIESMGRVMEASPALADSGAASALIALLSRQNRNLRAAGSGSHDGLQPGPAVRRDV